MCPQETRLNLHRGVVRFLLRKPDCTEALFVVSPKRCSLCPQETRWLREDVHCFLRKPDFTQKIFVVSSGNQIAPRRSLLCPQETRLHRKDVRCVLRKPDCTEVFFVVSSGNQIAPRRCYIQKNQTTPRCCPFVLRNFSCCLTLFTAHSTSQGQIHSCK